MRPAPFLRRRRGKQTDGGGTGRRCVLRLKWIDPSRREESRGEGSLIGSWQADGEMVQGAHRCSFTSGGVASIKVENWSWNSGEMFSKTIRCQCIDITFSCTLNQLFFFFFSKNPSNIIHSSCSVRQLMIVMFYCSSKYMFGCLN